jgi:2-polyprenyl-3-methyl-5-hydroxy-6-metoxy-1,4-benzoquinol methylase
LTLPSCPGCGSLTFLPRYESREICKEVEYRGRFVRRRLDHKPQPHELMDLTRFMHGSPERLVSCAACGLTVRDEPWEDSYSTDFYDGDLLEHLYPRYLHAFQKKECHYRPLLPHHAEVIEVGSHLGAFLEVAEQWNWRPTGLDIGAYTSTFAAGRGMRVRRQTIEDTQLPERSLDAVFVWNCFEQLQNPGRMLRAVRSLLKSDGMVVVRTPNFEFYEQVRRLTTLGRFRKRAIRALAYNNLLGFPYLVGYTPSSLAALLKRYGFEPFSGVDSTVLTMPFPNLTSKLRREAAKVCTPFDKPLPKDATALSGPWIEIACRPDHRQ